MLRNHFRVKHESAAQDGVSAPPPKPRVPASGQGTEGSDGLVSSFEERADLLCGPALDSELGKHSFHSKSASKPIEKTQHVHQFLAARNSRMTPTSRFDGHFDGLCVSFEQRAICIQVGEVAVFAEFAS